MPAHCPSRSARGHLRRPGPLRLPAHRPQQLLRLGRAATPPRIPRQTHRRRRHHGRHRHHHRRQLRVQSPRRQDPHQGRRSQKDHPRHHPRQRLPRDLRQVLARHRRRRRKGLPRRPHPLHRRDGLRTHRPRAGTAPRTPDCPRHQAGHQVRRRRNPALLDRHGPQPLPRQDRQRHAEARRPDRSASLANSHVPSRTSNSATSPA